MSIAHINIVSPLGSQQVSYRRSDPASEQTACARTFRRRGPSTRVRGTSVHTVVEISTIYGIRV
jgi:hypothetical protein